MELAVDHDAGADPGATTTTMKWVDAVAGPNHCSVAVRVLASFSRMTGRPSLSERGWARATLCQSKVLE